MRSICIMLTCAAVAGCSSPPTSRPNPNPVPGTSPTSGSSAAPTPRPAPPTPQATAPAPTAPSRSAPSLEQERAAQADRAAGALSRKAGVKVEKVETASPAWWPAGSGGGEGYGRGRGPTLDAAYQLATKQAAGGDRAAGVQRAGYSRTAMGEYVVWVAMGAQAAPLAAPPPAAPAPAPTSSAPTPATPAPTAPAPAAPSAPPAPMASDMPSWFNTKAKEENGRVIVGAMADAPTVREAPRMASEAGKAALAEVMGVEPSEVRLESTYVRKQGEGYRAYVLVSCAGTIKK